MAKNTHGGGANTNLHGLQFEQETSLKEALIKSGFMLKQCIITYNKNNIRKCNAMKVYDVNDNFCGIALQKHELYYYFELWENGLWKNYISKLLLPDEAFFNVSENKVYIIEKKFQSSNGSVDEKLQTCDFKREEYEKLFTPFGISIQYIYVLSDFYRDPKYDDVREYINNNNCKYFYNLINLSEIGL